MHIAYTLWMRYYLEMTLEQLDYTYSQAAPTMATCLQHIWTYPWLGHRDLFISESEEIFNGPDISTSLKIISASIIIHRKSRKSTNWILKRLYHHTQKWTTSYFVMPLGDKLSQFITIMSVLYWRKCFCRHYSNQILQKHFPIHLWLYR